MSGEPRKHHYIPIFYQRRFANSNGLLWVYDRLDKTYKELHPKSICFEKDLYATKPKEQPRDRRIESNVLSKVDDWHAKTIAAVVKAAPNAPSPDQLASLAVFAAIQHTRVPSNSGMITAMYEAGANDMMELAFANIERARMSLKRYERETGEELGISAESMMEAVKGEHVKAVATEIPFLSGIGEHTGFMAKTFASLDWQILMSPPQVGFILSDNPVAVVPPPRSVAVGILIPGTFTYVPLTRRLCVRLGKQVGRWEYQMIDRENVRYINQNTAINSERFIMGPDLTQLTSIVRRSKSEDMDGPPRFKIEKFVDTDGGRLRKVTYLPRNFIHTEDLD
jgi:hypothetical protein